MATLRSIANERVMIGLFNMCIDNVYWNLDRQARGIPVTLSGLSRSSEHASMKYSATSTETSMDMDYLYCIGKGNCGNLYQLCHSLNMVSCETTNYSGY